MSAAWVTAMLAALPLAGPQVQPPAQPHAPSPSPSPSAPAGREPGIGYVTAGTLAERCKSSVPADINACYAFIAAVHDTMRAYEIWLQQREFCPPATVTQGELRQAFLTSVSAYGERRSGLAASVVVVAIKEQFPCPTPDVKPVVEPPKE